MLIMILLQFMKPTPFVFTGIDVMQGIVNRIIQNIPYQEK